MTRTIYENTAPIAKRLGWLSLSEYCIGDTTLPYVRRDVKAGTFEFGTGRDASIWRMVNEVVKKTKASGVRK